MTWLKPQFSKEIENGLHQAVESAMLKVGRLTEAEIYELGIESVISYEADKDQIMISLKLRHGKRNILTMVDPVIYTNKELHDMVAEGLIGSVNLRSELYYQRLNSRFPNLIHNVDLEKSPMDTLVYISVQFKNGNVVKAPEFEVATPDFIARCCMMCDV